jgi:hypothetical protein
MGTVFTIVVLVLVAAVIGAIVFALFEVSPFARHKDHYRDPDTGERRWESPNLEDGHY